MAYYWVYGFVYKMHESLFGSSVIYLLLTIFHGYFINVLSSFSYLFALIYFICFLYYFRFVFMKLNYDDKSKDWIANHFTPLVQ